MASYLNQNGNSIGSLLRFIQEQKSTSPVQPQSSEVGSPIRDVVQQPLSGSEGQGTSKVVSLRPEGTLTPTGQPIEQGTPQSSRIGPISIGGPGDVTPNANIVAANEPGPGLGIPSATRTVGDVVNKTGLATPKIGTSIKAAPSTPGESVINYNFARDKANADKTFEDIKAGIAASERSVPETQAKLADLESRFASSMDNSDITAADQELLNRPFTAPGLAEAKQRTNEIKARLAQDPNAIYKDFGLPTPTPTPAPVSGGGTGQVLGAQSRPTSASMSYSKPTPKITYGKAPAVNIATAVKSGGLS